MYRLSHKSQPAERTEFMIAKVQDKKVRKNHRIVVPRHGGPEVLLVAVLEEGAGQWS